jgi:hypothetical protein
VAAVLLIVGFLVCLAATGLKVGAGQIPRERGADRLRALAVVVAAPSLVAPFLLAGVGAPPAARFIAGGFIGIQFLRVLEIVRAPGVFRRGTRAVRVLFAYETRTMKRAPGVFPMIVWAGGAALAAVGLGILVLVSRVAPPAAPYAPAAWPRWLATAVGGYLALEGAASHVCSVLRPFGWEHAPIQRAPILSRTVAEFWGARWNKVVSTGLRRNIFDPLARRHRMAAGVLASFAVSGLLHFYMTWPAAGFVPAVWMATFFGLHGVIVLVEARLGVSRWRPAAARAFTAAAFAVTMPLFAEPFMRGLGL